MKKILLVLVGVLMLVLVGGMVSADCLYYWNGGASSSFACGANEACCDEATNTDCGWGEYPFDPYYLGGYSCVETDTTYEAAQASCCSAEVDELLDGCVYDPDYPQDYDCMNGFEDPCVEADTDYVGWSSVFRYTGGLYTDWLCLDDYPNPNTPRRMINWIDFADERMYDLTKDTPWERTESVVEPWNVLYGNAGTSTLCGDDVDFYGPRIEWYQECIPFNIYDFPWSSGDSVYDVVACADGPGGEPSYACCDHPSSCVYNHQCYTSATNALVYGPLSVWFVMPNSDEAQVDTDDSSPDKEVCIRSFWVDPDSFQIACDLNPASVWMNYGDNYCEPAERGWGPAGTCTDDDYHLAMGYSNAGFCCGDDPNENPSGENCLADSGPCTVPPQSNHFKITSNAGNTVAQFGDLGYLEIAGTVQPLGAVPYGSGIFAVQESGGTAILYIDQNGNLFTDGTMNEDYVGNMDTLVSSYDVFGIQDASSSFVSLIVDNAGNGDIYLTGCIAEGVAFP